MNGMELPSRIPTDSLSLRDEYCDSNSLSLLFFLLISFHHPHPHNFEREKDNWEGNDEHTHTHTHTLIHETKDLYSCCKGVFFNHPKENRERERETERDKERFICDNSSCSIDSNKVMS